MTRYKLLACVLWQFSVVDPLTLLFTHYSKCILIAIDRLIEVESVEAIWLVCHVGSSGDDVIVGSLIGINIDASSFEHFEIV